MPPVCFRCQGFHFLRGKTCLAGYPRMLPGRRGISKSPCCENFDVGVWAEYLADRPGVAVRSHAPSSFGSMAQVPDVQLGNLGTNLVGSAGTYPAVGRGDSPVFVEVFHLWPSSRVGPSPRPAARRRGCGVLWRRAGGCQVRLRARAPGRRRAGAGMPGGFASGSTAGRHPAGVGGAPCVGGTCRGRPRRVWHRDACRHRAALAEQLATRAFRSGPSLPGPFAGRATPDRPLPAWQVARVCPTCPAGRAASLAWREPPRRGSGGGAAFGSVRLRAGFSWGNSSYGAWEDHSQPQARGVRLFSSKGARAVTAASARCALSPSASALIRSAMVRRAKPGPLAKTSVHPAARGCTRATAEA